MFWPGEERLDGPVNFTNGPAATAGEIWDTSRDFMIKTRNSDTEIVNAGEAYDAMSDNIFKLTGQRFDNPFRYHRPNVDPETGQLEDRHSVAARVQADFVSFHEKVKALELQYPDDKVGVSVRELALEAEKKYQDMNKRYEGGFLPMLSWLGGTMSGAMRDPINAYTMLLGGGAAKTFMGGVAKAGLINAATETAIQPIIHDWRKRHKLKHTWGESLKDIAFAGLFGAGADAGLRGIGRGINKISGGGGRNREEIAKILEKEIDDLPDAAVIDLVNIVKDHADPADMDALRGAMLSINAERDLMMSKSGGVVDADHTDAMIKSIRHALDPDNNPAPARSPQAIRKAKEKPLHDDAPAPVKKGESFSYYDKPVAFQSFDANGLTFDAKNFQFKGDGDASGVTAKLRGVEKWNPLAANKVFVFEQASGARIIADGHQRLGLAKRLIDQGHEEKISLDGYLFREADGWSASDVRVIAAKKNLQEGTGTVMGAARIIREAPDVIDDSVPVSSHAMRQARHLARLSDEAFGMVINDVVKPGHAAMVAEFIGDESRHASVLRELAELQPTNEMQARQMINDINALPTTTQTQNTLFGEFRETRSLFLHRAKIMDSSIKTLKGEKKIFKMLVDEADRLELAGNAVNRAGNITIVDQAGQVAELLTKLATRTGPVSDILNRQAARMAEGASLKQARTGFVDEVRELFEEGGLEALTATSPKARLVPDDGELAGGGLGRGLEDLMEDGNKNTGRDAVQTAYAGVGRKELAGPDEMFRGFEQADRLDQLAQKIEVC